MKQKKATKKSIPPQEKGNSFNRHGWIIALFALLLYSNTLTHDFTLDDTFVIQNNSLVQEGIAGIPELLTTDYWEGPLKENKVSKLYRPLSLVTFAIEESVFGLDPSVSHFINVVLYALLCVLVFSAFRTLFPQWPVLTVFFVALLFASHPLHTESVANLKGRAEILAGVFLMASLLYFFKWDVARKSSTLFAAAFCFFLALLSKEDALTFAAVIPLALWIKSRDNTLGTFAKRYTSPLLAVAVPALLMLTMRNLFADTPDKSFSYIENPLEKVEGLKYVFNALHVAGDYLIQLLLPISLVHDYSFSQIDLISGISLKMLLALLVLGAALFFGFKWTLQKKPEGFILLFFLLTFSVASNLFITIGVMKAERLMFMPLLAVAMSLPFLCMKMQERGLIDKKWTTYILVGVVALFSIKTYSRNPDWKNNEALITADIDKSERNVKTKSNYAGILRAEAIQASGQEQQNLLEEAKKHLWECTVIAPDYNRPWIDLGYIFEMQGKYDSAVYVFEKAHALFPDDQNLVHRLALNRVYADTAFVRGLTLVNAKQFRQAIPIFDSLASLHPNNFEIWFYRGGVHFNSKNYFEAKEAWERAKQLNPNDPRIDEPLGHARAAVKDMTE